MKIEQGVALSRFTTLGAGGPAKAFARPESVEELEEALAWAREEGLPVATIGLGSNLLVADDGFDGLVLKLGGELAEARVEGERLSRAAELQTLSVCTACARPVSVASSSRARSRARSAAVSG